MCIFCNPKIKKLRYSGTGNSPNLKSSYSSIGITFLLLFLNYTKGEEINVFIDMGKTSYGLNINCCSLAYQHYWFFFRLQFVVLLLTSEDASEGHHKNSVFVFSSRLELELCLINLPIYKSFLS